MFLRFALLVYLDLSVLGLRGRILDNFLCSASFRHLLSSSNLLNMRLESTASSYQIRFLCIRARSLAPEACIDKRPHLQGIHRRARALICKSDIALSREMRRLCSCPGSHTHSPAHPATTHSLLIAFPFHCMIAFHPALLHKLRVTQHFRLPRRRGPRSSSCLRLRPNHAHRSPPSHKSTSHIAQVSTYHRNCMLDH